MTSKTLLAFAVGVALCASTAFGQCPNGNCGRVYYSPIAPRYSGFYVIPNACEAVRQCEPTVAPCDPIETVQPCDPVAECAESVVEPCAPVETCAPSTEKFDATAKELDECLTGACPLRAATRAAVKTATTPIRVVASLLDRVNATRARYGLPALQYDATLEAGAQRQASYCASIGDLRHGGGAAEILAQSPQGLEDAINQWLRSPRHRAMLLSGGYRYAGVSVVRDRYGRNWCAMRFR